MIQPERRRRTWRCTRRGCRKLYRPLRSVGTRRNKQECSADWGLWAADCSAVWARISLEVLGQLEERLLVAAREQRLFLPLPRLRRRLLCQFNLRTRSSTLSPACESRV